MFLFEILMSINPERIARSTAEAFTEFYNRYLPKVYRYFSYKVTDVHLAEDLTSTVFEKALIKFKSYHADKSKFSTWLFRIARNTLIDHFRTSSRHKTVPLDPAYEGQEDKDTPERVFLQNEEKQVLHDCIARLSPREQEIVSLKFGADMNNRQIAGIIGISDSNVGVILFRAVRKLRESYSGLQHE